MVRNRKVTGRAVAMSTGVMIGTLLAVLLTVTGAALAAYLIDGGIMAESAVGYAAMLILLVASVAGSWMAASLVKRQRLVVCLITGGVYMLLMLGLTAFCFGGQYQGVVPTLLLIAGGSTASALAGNLGQGNRTPGRHNRRYG